ncbi:MAG: DUF1353 domain-containing protein [Actinomycetota bacterium]|nr:DUF1353 domain-containing protein [Actinomycetota bacterium]MDQ3355034.1 DUF1353 domain-containing protein [Actinomycetota bacterium]
MSQFTAPLLVTPLDDGETWIIVSDDFRYDVGHEGSDDRVEVPQWMATDFASVPRPIWWFAAPWGRHGHAAVLHDAGYYLQDRSRAEYDRIFLEAMGVLGVGRLKRRLMYLAVHWFGRWPWATNARRNRAEPGWKVHDPRLLGLVEATSPAQGGLRHQREDAPAVRHAFEAVKRSRPTPSS